MNRLCRAVLFFSWFSALSLFLHADPAAAPRERQLFDQGWRFALGHATDMARDFEYGTGYFSQYAKAGYGDGPAAAGFDDRAWRKLDLPHDWVVELPFDWRGSASHGFRAVGRNFSENSIGWYRKSFDIPESDLGRRISFEFDGVFRDSDVWVNGFHLGHEPSGYTSFRYDVTDYLNYGGHNVITVRANATMEEGWFYEGAGIYRHVWLTKTAPLHVAWNGTAITTDVQGAKADIAVSSDLVNEGGDEVTFDVEQTVLGPDGRSLASAQAHASAPAGAHVTVPVHVAIAQPQLWTLEKPALHRLVTTVKREGKLVDRTETAFGIRTIRFDPDHGFFLNGERVELKGMNVHQDHAGLGVALPDAMQEYRIARLKEFGVNAYRCSHNPPTPELLDACDRLGMLVIDENRLMGSNPAQLVPLEEMIRRDRNHPSVILWSVGNEEWAIEGNIKGARITSTMQAVAQRLDPSRRTTVAISGGWGGTSTTVDVVGYNYIHQSNPDDQHAKFPHQPGVGTEESSTQTTRGIYVDDRAKAHLAPLEHGDSGGNCEIGWTYYAARPFLAGLFFWTGFDYRGEPTPFGWPAMCSQFGLLDLCGFRKDPSYYLESWWTERPVLHLATHWNWAGREGQDVKVVCYSNHDAVELLLNGASLGRKDVPRNGHVEWQVRYAPGVLEARGFRGGKVVGTERIETTDAPAKLTLTADRTSAHATPADVVVFTVGAQDAKGRAVPTADNRVDFAVTGGRIIGVGNGDPSCHDPEQFNETVAVRTVEDWRGRIAPAGTTAPGDAATLEPMPALGRWRAPLPKVGEVYDLTGTFTLDEASKDGRVELFLPSFGRSVTVWLNGKVLARDLDCATTGPSLTLAPSDRLVGVNRVQLIVTPFNDDRGHIPETTRVGSVQVTLPAPKAYRPLFNGLAQVIVQASPGASAVHLTATSANLTSTEAIVPVVP